MTKPVRDGDQPMPTPNEHPAVQAAVVDDLLTYREHVVTGVARETVLAVVDDLNERLQVGIARYGTPLQPHNGRDALRDAYEEALDLLCYLKQADLEGLGTALLRSSTRSIVIDLRSRLAAREAAE